MKSDMKEIRQGMKEMNEEIMKEMKEIKRRNDERNERGYDEIIRMLKHII